MEPCQNPQNCKLNKLCKLVGRKVPKRYYEFCAGTSGLSREKEEGYLRQIMDQPPPLLERAGNLISSIADYAKSGCSNVDRDEYERRMAICRGCDRYKQDFCMVCGCNMPIKAWMAEQVCPRGLWSLPNDSVEAPVETPPSDKPLS